MRLRLLMLCLWALARPDVSLAAEPLPEVSQIDVEVGKKADWLSQTGTCPASVMPKRIPAGQVPPNNCRENLAKCLPACDAGDGGACYWLANAVVQGGGKSETSEALFQRSCKLGVASGCTNRAAGMLSETPTSKPAQRCAAQTFARTCALDDPWGCTMYAGQLARGEGTKVNRKLALRVLEKSCKYGERDPACIYGKKLRVAIEEKLQAPGAVK